MKKLLIVRHAKSSGEHHLNDHDRPLNERGISDAHLVSNHLNANDLAIDLAISSDAVRAKTTANIFVENLHIQPSIFHVEPDLYDFSGNNLIRIIKNCDNRVHNLMVFGHNHAITAFVNTFGDRYIENVPTCGVVTILFDVDRWQDLTKGKTISALFPRDLKNDPSF
ncbi:MAG: histidine phosphatase family protein [Confluentibacter sp.]|nr:histidine phosphatase family protein [Confluentibacter sp.]